VGLEKGGVESQENQKKKKKEGEGIEAHENDQKKTKLMVRPR
jgi:hypothetical protein